MSGYLSEKDIAYAERDQLVAALGKLAIAIGGKCWLAQHDPADESWEDEWRTIVYVWFPVTGQMSWHIHSDEIRQFNRWANSEASPWDGHTTEEKYRRLERLGHLPIRSFNE